MRLAGMYLVGSGMIKDELINIYIYIILAEPEAKGFLKGVVP